MRVPYGHVLCALLPFASADRLLGAPTLPFTPTSNGALDIASIKAIVVDESFANHTDTSGSTLIPPTLGQFADTFATDLSALLHRQLSASTGTSAQTPSIILTLGNSSSFVDAAGRPTSEGYSITVNEKGISIVGASPLGAWWGTRTVIQQFILNNGTFPFGAGTDSPGWGTRGVMLDAGRHYYPPSFLVEMCAYLSFFKQNTFHLHLSDNLFNNVDIYSRERTLTLYATFRLLSNDSSVAGLDIRKNESYTQTDFENIQQTCASRGVTIIPEIEAPGHALVITQWKPELGLEDDLSLLNISNPLTIPTMQDIWATFLPWFHSKVVHIGADEYVDASLTKNALVAEYTRFVNAMSTFIQNASDKTIRIWGTFPPMPNVTNVDQSVSIQHWEFFEDNPLVDFIDNGYDVLNSDDATYIVGKWSGSYPQQLNVTRIFKGAPGGGPLLPNIFDRSNSSNNPSRNNPSVLGHVAAQWNDYGPNATVYSEAFYAWRNGLAALADKQWGGTLLEDEYEDIFDTLHTFIPGQNLERRIASRTSTIVSYNFSTPSKKASNSRVIKDLSGNGYDAATNCEADDGLHLTSGCSIQTPLKSKGRNYTLSFSINPSASSQGSIFTGLDSQLVILNEPSRAVALVAGGNAFALNYTFPVNEWTEASLIGRGNQTFLGLSDNTEMEFLTVLGINGASFVWAPIAIEAPLSVIGGSDFDGRIGFMKLVDFA